MFFKSSIKTDINWRMTRLATRKKDKKTVSGEGIDRATWAAWAAEDRKARDIVILELAEMTSLADYFLICTATSGRQVKAIADNIDETLHKKGVRLLHSEGFEEMSWVLLDYDDLVVHIFTEEAREFYRLERLWADAKHLPVPPRAETAVGRTAEHDNKTGSGG